jgi:nucleoside phosphorylase
VLNEPTLGIVTAIPEEFAAVKTILDFAEAKSMAGDPAHYQIGTVPSAVPAVAHRVVATLMQRAGNDIAATSCTNLLRTFPSVNAIIMCGIAAGVPCPDQPQVHVALGDIVAATWGIIDYDHVDETDEGAVLRPGFPRPSPFFNNGANLLRVAEFEGRRPWEQWLARSIRSLPACYRRPTSADASEDANRAGRPRVHYGLIGSADRSLRTAEIRDALAAKYDLRALEMEGKGIGNSAFLNGLEWFVVRGISDHGDRSTGSLWRPYAALAAAAYVRALMAECGPLEPRGGHARGDATPNRSMDRGIGHRGVSYNGLNIHTGPNNILGAERLDES